MKRIKIYDKVFGLYLPNKKICSIIDELASRMNRDLTGKNPLFLCILNGSFMFAAELFKRINMIETEISFIRVASYDGTGSTGKVKELMGLNETVEGRTVVILEDIVDTGITIEKIINQVKSLEPREVYVATLLFKPDAVLKPVHLDYVGMEIPNDFIIGFGLDYNGRGRNLKEIYSVIG